MPKNKILVCVPMLLSLTIGCNPAYHKVTYVIPDTIPAANRAELISTINTGKILFKNNCAKCHGVLQKGHKGIPDFTTQQIDNYSARFIAGDTQNHAIAAGLQPQQLNAILMFLRFKSNNAKK